MSPVLRSRTAELVRRLKTCARANGCKTSSRKSWGVPLTLLRTVCKGVPRPDGELAAALWAHGEYEARQAAALLADAPAMTQTLLEQWIKETDCPELCDFCALHVFSKTKTPLKLAEKWLKKEHVFMRRAGIQIIGVLAAARGGKTEDKEFGKFFPVLKNHAADPRPEIHEAVSKTLRALGQRNLHLKKAALACADEILDLFPANRTACWTAKNVRWALDASSRKK